MFEINDGIKQRKYTVLNTFLNQLYFRGLVSLGGTGRDDISTQFGSRGFRPYLVKPGHGTRCQTTGLSFFFCPLSPKLALEARPLRKELFFRLPLYVPCLYEESRPVLGRGFSTPQPVVENNETTIRKLNHNMCILQLSNSIPALPGNSKHSISRGIVRHLTTCCRALNLTPGPGMNFHLYAFCL